MCLYSVICALAVICLQMRALPKGEPRSGSEFLAFTHNPTCLSLWERCRAATERAFASCFSWQITFPSKKHSAECFFSICLVGCAVGCLGVCGAVGAFRAFAVCCRIGLCGQSQILIRETGIYLTGLQCNAFDFCQFRYGDKCVALLLQFVNRGENAFYGCFI